MTAPINDWPDSALDAVDTAFGALTCEPQPLSLDVCAFGADSGPPPGAVPLPVVRRWLLEHPHDYAVRDAVWRSDPPGPACRTRAGHRGGEPSPCPHRAAMPGSYGCRLVR